MRGPTSPGAPRTSHYDVLQVSPHASPEVIQAAYRVLARENHPDVNPSVEAARRMLQVNAAYDILSDSQRRAQYDLQLARTSRVVTARPVAVTSPIRRIAPARPTAWTGPEPVQTGRARSLLAVVMAVLAFILFLSLVLWILAANLDEAPPVSTPGRVGYTALNQFSIAAVRSVARKATEFETNAAAI